jgi:hypothetical protein
LLATFGAKDKGEEVAPLPRKEEATSERHHRELTPPLKLKENRPPSHNSL